MQNMGPTIGRHESFELSERKLSKIGDVRPKMHFPSTFLPAEPTAPKATELSVLAVVKSESGLLTFTMNRSSGRFDPSTRADLDISTLAEQFLISEHVSSDRRKRTYSSGAVIIVPDRATVRELMSRVSRDVKREGNSSRSAKRLLAALEICRSFPSSSRLVVLSEALALRYYLPVDLDEGSFEDWAQALMIGRPRSINTVGEAINLVYECTDQTRGNLFDIHDEYKKELRSISALFYRYTHAETVMIALSQYRNLSTECGRFSSLSTATNIWAYLNARDKIRREYYRISGDVFRLSHAHSDVYTVHGSASVREGKAIHHIDDRNSTRKSLPIGDTVRSIRVNSDGVMTMQISRQLPDGDYLEVPYVPSFTGAEGRKWVASPGSAHAPARVRREVPLYLTLAGSPVHN